LPGSFETRLQGIDGRFGQDELLAAENVVDVDALHGEDVNLRDVARGKLEVCLGCRTVDDQGVGQAKLGETRLQRFGLGIARVGFRPYDDRAILGLGGKGVFEGERAQLFRQIMSMRAHDWAESTSATANCGTRAEPCRADPVPFCLYNFLPVRQMSARPNV